MARIIILDDLGHNIEHTSSFSGELERIGHNVIHLTRDFTLSRPMRARRSDIEERVSGYLETLPETENSEVYLCAFGAMSILALSAFADFRGKLAKVVLLNPMCVTMDSGPITNTRKPWVDYHTMLGSFNDIDPRDMYRLTSAVKFFCFGAGTKAKQVLRDDAFCVIPSNEISADVSSLFPERLTVLPHATLEHYSAQLALAAFISGIIEPT